MILGLLLAALVSWKPRKTTSTTKPLNKLLYRPCRMSPRRLSDVYQDPDALQPRGWSPAMLFSTMQSYHPCQSYHPHHSRQSHRPHHAASHRVTPVTASHANRSDQRVRPPGSGLRARGGGAVKLCLPPGNNGRGFEEGHLHRFTWHTHPQQTYSNEPISVPTRC